MKTRYESIPTGVQEVFKALKILDSGLRRNDGKWTQINFFTPSGRVRVGGAKSTGGEVPEPSQKSVFPFACKGQNNILGNFYAPVEII